MRSFDPDEYRPDAEFDSGQPVDNVFAFKEQLRRDYEGVPFERVMPGEVVESEYGCCYLLRATERGALRRSTADELRQNLLGSVHLVRGIRQKTQARLEEQGFRSLADLENHPRFCGESRRIRELVKNADTGGLAEIVGARLSRSHPSVLGLSSLHDDADFLFLDLETMGLFAGQPVVVAGIASLGPDNVIDIRQYVVRDFPDELALVAEVGRAVAQHKVLVTYNGKSFDLPFLVGRSAYYGLRLEQPRLHFDLLHFCRRAWRDELEGCSLRTIEQTILGLSRDTDLPGDLVPEFYYDYLRTGNAGFLKPIVDHNRQDVASLVNVFSSLVEHWQEKGT